MQLAGGRRWQTTLLISKQKHIANGNRRNAACQAIAAPPAPQQQRQQHTNGKTQTAENGWHGSEHQAAAPADESGKEITGYKWEKQLYPVAIVSDLDPKRPHAIQLLGNHMVLWRDNQQTWRCFEDRCPHRLAPLSEGRIEPSDGSLFCNYHGWRFRGDGSCAGIPQLPETQSSALNSPRACAVSYPTREAEGLLWVWPSSGKTAEAEADAAGYPGMCPELDSGKAKTLTNGWYFRDTYSHYLSAKENAFTDPSHDAILHHGSVGKRDSAAPIFVAGTEMSLQGFSVSYARSPPAQSSTQSALAPSAPDPDADGSSSHSQPKTAFTDVTKMPVGALRQIDMPGSGRLLMFGYFVPLSNNLTRHFINFSTVSDNLKAPLPLRIMGRLPEWGTHLFLHTILDADIATQAGVDRNRRRGKGNNVFVPAGSDRGVVSLQRWLRKYAGDSLPVPETEPPSLSRRELLDRQEEKVKEKVFWVPTLVVGKFANFGNRHPISQVWLGVQTFHTHTEQCPSCMRAFKTALLVQKVAGAAFAALFVASAASLAVRGLAQPSLVLAVVCAGCGLATAASSWLIKHFTFKDYSHAEGHTSKGS